MLPITRIFTTEDGQSHFEDVHIEGPVQPSPVSSGASEYCPPIAATSVVLRRVVSPHPPTPHVSPRRQLVVQLTGRMEVETSDGETREFGPGTCLLLEDTTGTGHTTREIPGSGPRTTMFIELADQHPGPLAGQVPKL